jgi:hypothetical protein
MLSLTLAEAEAQLATVNTAIQQLISGKKVTELHVGSGAFQRFYKYQECSMENLLQLRAELLGLINTLSPSLPTFAGNMSFQNIVRKGSY